MNTKMLMVQSAILFFKLILTYCRKGLVCSSSNKYSEVMSGMSEIGISQLGVHELLQVRGLKNKFY